jgi:hypothetical protein
MNTAKNLFSQNCTFTFFYTSPLPQAKHNKQRKKEWNLTTLGGIINKNQEGIYFFIPRAEGADLVKELLLKSAVKRQQS